MLKELHTAALSMVSQQTRLEVTANNISNAATPGFKKESVFEKTMIDAGASMNNLPGQTEQADPPIGTYTDFTQGVNQKTDNPLDIAIDNKNGFFTLQDEEGNQYLSRAGHFTVTMDGYVTATDGKYLLGTSGVLNLNEGFSQESLDFTDSKAAAIKVSDQGEVLINDRPIGKLQITEVSNPGTLKRISSTEFSLTDEANVRYLPQEEVSVKQGWLENSNVDIVGEMVKMIELQRMFELGSKVIHTNNETMDLSFRLGRFI